MVSANTRIDVSSFDVSNVTNMYRMFYGNGNATEIKLPAVFNASACSSMAMMFMNCSKVTNLNTSGFSTPNVGTMLQMFQGCAALTSLDVSSFNTMKVTSTQNMFYGCTNLTSMDVRSFDLPLVNITGGMFENCRSLKALNSARRFTPRRLPT